MWLFGCICTNNKEDIYIQAWVGVGVENRINSKFHTYGLIKILFR